MTEKEILQRFKEDFDKIESPDLWDKIQEKKAVSEPIREIKPKKRNVRFLYALSACIAVMLVGIGVLAVVMKGGTAPIIEPSQASSPEPSGQTSQVSEISREEADLIEQLKIKQIYGDFALSDRKEEELETILNAYNENNQVYEDDDYLYNFDDKGRLIEMILINHDTIGGEIAGREDIEKKVEEIFETYFPNVNINDYEVEVKESSETPSKWAFKAKSQKYSDTSSQWLFDVYFYKSGVVSNVTLKVEIEEHPDASPRWTADIYLCESEVVIYNIYIALDEYGKIQYLSLPEITKDTGNISREQAIQIALDEAQSGKYPFSKFDREDVEIFIKYREKNNQKCHYVVLENIPMENAYTMASIGFDIDIYNGNIINVYSAF